MKFSWIENAVGWFVRFMVGLNTKGNQIVWDDNLTPAERTAFMNELEELKNKPCDIKELKIGGTESGH